MIARTVTVIGANGNMGSKMSAIFASFGGAKTYMVSRRKADAVKAVSAAVKSVRAGSIENRLVPIGYDQLDECVVESDLVFESVAERLDVKLDALRHIGSIARPGTYICTGTSGLSIKTLASVLPDTLCPTFMGTHFFNPPYAMPLCELIGHSESNPDAMDQMETYLRDVLLRKVVRTSDAPAFLANRIGFHTINRAMKLAEAEADAGGVDYIDSILGPFTGRAMAPLRTADFVGLDVHGAIVDNVRTNAPDWASVDFEMPSFARGLANEGKLGVKAGWGLYHLERDAEGRRIPYVWDIASSEYRPSERYALRFADRMVSRIRVGDYDGAATALCSNASHEARLCLDALVSYMAYATWCSLEVAHGPSEADEVMANGFNWCPPLALADWLGTAVDVRELVASYLEPSLGDAEAANIADAIVPSNYDYRRYVRARR